MSSPQGSIEEAEKIKRPMNAFILWSRKRRRELASEDPNMHNFEISKRLGIEWNRLEPKEKKQFYDEAQKLKEEHRRSYPDYKYHPRRKPRRRFTPINPPPRFRMTYLLPSERAYQENGSFFTCPGFPAFNTSSYHRMNGSLLPGYPSNQVPPESSLFQGSHQLELRYLPQQYLVNGTAPIPTTYYGIQDIPKVPASMSLPSEQGEAYHLPCDKEGELPVEILTRFTPTGLMKREALLRRAAEGSLEYRMRTNKEEPNGNRDTRPASKEQGLDPRKSSVHFEKGKNFQSGLDSGVRFHGHLSSGHLCLGCHGGVPFYHGVRSTTSAPQTVVSSDRL